MLLNNTLRLLQSRNGAIAMMTALSMPVLVGSAALATDVIQTVWLKRAMQRHADSAALAGAFAVLQGKAALPSVNMELTRNAFSGLPETSIIENAPTTGAYAGNVEAVRVVLTAQLNLPFSAFILRRNQVVTVEATAANIITEQNCLTVLETGNRPGLSITGSADLQFSCSIFSNSPNAKSVDPRGGKISPSSVSAVGGLPMSSAYPSTVILHPYVAATLDPYASLPTPSVTSSSPDPKPAGSSTVTLNPGTYNGLTLKGTVILNSGVYYIDGSAGGALTVDAGANVTGNGVTIILTSSKAASVGSSVADMTINGGGMINLTAPTSGPYANILIYQDRRADDSGGAKINGDSRTKLSGAIYMPARELKMNGNSSIDFTCLKMVARRLIFSGNSAINNTCTSGAYRGNYVRLVA